MSRYKPGKRPEYAPSPSNENEESPEEHKIEEEEPVDAIAGVSYVTSAFGVYRRESMCRSPMLMLGVHSVEEPEVIYEQVEEEEEEEEEGGAANPEREVTVWEESSD